MRVLALAVLLAGCTGTVLEDHGLAPPPPAEAGTTCRLMVSGIGGAPTESYFQDNACFLLDAGPLDIHRGAEVHATVNWTALQPTLSGRVQATLQDTSCPEREPCILGQASAHRKGPIILRVASPAMEGHRLDRLAVVVHPDGISYQQTFDVRIRVLQDAAVAAQPGPAPHGWAVTQA